MKSLAENNIDIVEHVFNYLCKKWGRVPDYDLKDDLKGAGFLALCQVATETDDNEELRRLAFPRIRGAMIDEMGKTYKLNKRDWKLYKKMQAEAIRESCNEWDPIILDRFGKKGEKVLAEVFAGKIHFSMVEDNYEFEVREILDSVLSKNESAIFWDYYFVGMTLKEIGKRFKTKPEVIRQKKARGIRKLKRYYKYNIS